MKKILLNITQEHISKALGNTPFFSGLDTQALNDLSKQFTPIFIEAESILMNEGDEGDSLYVVIKGRLRVIKNFNQESQEILREIGSEELIGEFAMLTGEPRIATVIAMRDSVLLKLSKAAFLEFVQSHPLQLLGIAKHSILRLVNPKKPQKNNIVTIVVMPAGEDAQTYHDFVHRLTAELCKIAPTLHINYKNLSIDLREDEFLLTNWLSEQEANFRYIVYETDQTYTPWTELCIRQGDQILTIAAASSDSTLNPIEEHIYAETEIMQKAVDLVLIHPDSTVIPSHTNIWFKKRRLKQHHHIKENAFNGYAHLVRYLTGHCIALVLSGGGARGIAHIGTYRAIVESGIPVDMVAGSSLGSVMGAMIATGLTWQEMLVVTRKYLIDNKGLFDYTFPVTSLVRGRNWKESIKSICGEDVNIEDLWLPFFCVSTNITQNCPHVHRTGSLWKSIRASLSIPAVSPPISTEEGDLLIDGGIVNNMPVDLMQKLIKGGKIIAVSVSRQNRMRSDLFPDGEYSGWNALIPRFMRADKNAEKVPSIADIIDSTISLAASHHLHLMSLQADLFIDLKVQQFGMFDFKSFDALVETGYQETMKILKDFSWRGA